MPRVIFQPNGELASGEFPSLIIGGGEVEGTNVSVLSNITVDTLEREYGYSVKDTTETMKMLNLMQVPLGRESYYRDELESKVKQAVRSSGGNGKLWETLVKELGSRSDTMYNIANHAGMNSFMHTDSYVRSGMTPSSLTNYVTRMQGSNRGIKRNGKTSLPVYVRDVESFGKSDDRITFDDAVPVIIDTTSKSNRSNVNTGEIVNSSSLGHNHYSPTETNNVPHFSDYTIDTTIKEKNQLPQSTDPETMRLRRIEAEYEKEKAEWEKKKQPVLARSATHDLGHAEGSGEGEIDNPIKVGKRMFELFMGRLS